MTVEADVSVRTQVEPMVDRVWNELGPIDILVNNAGIEDNTPAVSRSHRRAVDAAD